MLHHHTEDPNERAFSVASRAAHRAWLLGTSLDYDLLVLEAYFRSKRGESKTRYVRVRLHGCGLLPRDRRDVVESEIWSSEKVVS